MLPKFNLLPAGSTLQALLANSAAAVCVIAVTSLIAFECKATTADVPAHLPVKVATTEASKALGSVARGRYLVKAMGCADCHTPLKMGPKGPEPDFSRGLSGHPQDFALPPAPAAQGPWMWGGAATNTAFWGPWGVSYAANLTSDKATGIGAWTDGMFINAMRRGKQMGGGRPLLPPMPWQAVGQLSNQDLRAMLAYLKSEPAIQNRVPLPTAPSNSPAVAATGQ